MNKRQIIPGETYVYVNGIPKWAYGQRYLVHRFIMDVPSYQVKVLVEALSGKDQGLWFCCSLANFVVRYEPERDLGSAEVDPKSLRMPVPASPAEVVPEGIGEGEGI